MRARNDFLQYRKLINHGLVFNWFVIELAEELQKFVEDLEAGLKPMLIIEAPPQHGKSEAIIDIISWVAGRNPNLRTIFASFSERLGVRANLKLQRIYSKKVYKDIFPNTKINSKDLKTDTNFTRNREILEYVNKEGYFRNTTVQGSITGESLDLGVIDDPLKGREAANSITTRNKTWEWFTDDFFTRFSEGAGLLMILTRWHVDDPAARLIAQNPRVKVLKYKALAEEDEEHRLQGEALIPQHKSKEFLLERRKLMGENFEALYQQNPVVKGGNLLKTEWIKYISRDVINGMKFERTFITVDSALKDKEKNDYTVYSAWGVFEKRVYWLDMFRGKPLSNQREITLKAFYNKNNIYPFQGAYIEQKASGIDLFQRLKYEDYMVFGIERNTDKIFRANGITNYLEIYGLNIAEDIPNMIELLNEYQQFPNSKNDDIVDTLLDSVELTYIHHSSKEVDWDEI